MRGIWFKRPYLWCCVLSAVAVAAVTIWWQSAERSHRPPGITAEEWAAAEITAVNRLRRSPAAAEVCLTLARQAIRDGRVETALVCFDAVPASDPEHGLQAMFERSSLLFDQSRAGLAEVGFRQILEASMTGRAVPGRQRLYALRTLSLLYGVQMRTGQRAAILRQLMDARQGDVHEAKYYFFPSLLVWQNDWGASRVRDWLKNEPNSRPLQNAAARYLIGEGQLDAARGQLEVLHAADPADLETAAFLLECCREQNDASRFKAICSKLPPESADEPLLLTEYRGKWLLDRQEWQQAEACFQRLLKRNPANPAAWQGLAECSDRLGQSERRLMALDRVAVLARLRVGLAPAVPENPEAIRAVADWCRQLEMPDAAMAFDFFGGGRGNVSSQ
jgi:thioredoxin-like negative regulator of GroEL